MKKLCLILSVIITVMFCCAVGALADAAAYDVNNADYYVYVTTPDGGLNMRHGPGTDYSLVTTSRIPDGVRLYIGYTSGNWGYTSYNGNSGWVALSQTSPAPAPSSNQSYTKEKAGYYVYVATPDGGLNLRHGPGTEYDCAIDGRIPDGVKLYIEYVSGNWGLTHYQGTQGWVALKQTTTTPPSTSTPAYVPESDNEEPVTDDAELGEENDSSDASVDEQLETIDEAVSSESEEIVENTSASEEDINNVKSSMSGQVLLIVLILVAVVIVALLIIVIINMNNRNRG